MLVNWIIRIVVLFILSSRPLSSEEIFLWKYNEWNMLEIVAKLLPERPVVVQAGACEGERVFKLLQFVPKAKVFAFEPNPAHFKKLKEKSVWFKGDVQIVNCALDAWTREAPFFLSPNPVNPRIGSLLPGKEEWSWYYKRQPSYSVQAYNLQSWAFGHGISQVDFLWLDIGGAELRVLRSIPRLIDTVQVILVETQFQEFRERAGIYSDLLAFMEEIGMEEINHWHVPDFHGYALFARRGLAEVIR